MMALVVQIGVTNSHGGIQPIETLEIRRLEPLRVSDRPDLIVYPYMATVHEFRDGGFAPGQTATLEHRYGDGAKTLVSNALAALGYPESEVR